MVDGDQSGNSFAFRVLTADNVSWAFGGDHDDVDIGRRNEGFKVDGETVTEDEGLALFEIGADVFFKGIGLLGIGDGDKNHVGFFDRFGGIEYWKAFFGGDGAGL